MFISVGTVIDQKYEIRQTIGSGGMGVVYEAYHREMDRTVALKLLTSDPDEEPEEKKRFLREASLLNRLSHPNIVAFYAYGVWNGQPYIVMERLYGPSLQQVLAHRDGPVNRNLALAAALQVCNALQHAHAEGVFHRDIKPSNIILSQPAGTAPDEGGKVHAKLIDFGLAKGVNLQEQQKLTRTNQALGSVNYMSPEQCVSHPVDARSDIYSLGCVLYECTTGKPPFSAENAVAMMFQHLNESVSDTPDWPNVPPDLQKVIRKCMAKQPAKRYGSAGELARDLETVLSGGTISQRESDFSEESNVKVTGGQTIDEFRRFLSGDGTTGTHGRTLQKVAPWVVLAVFVIGAVLVFGMMTGFPGHKGEIISVNQAAVSPKQVYTDAKVALAMGQRYFAGDNRKDGWDALSQADSLIERPSYNDVRTKYAVKRYIGAMYSKERDIPKANACFRAALQYSQQEPPRERIALLIECSRTAENLQNFPDSLRFLQQAYVLTEKVVADADSEIYRASAHRLASTVAQMTADCYEGLKKPDLAEAELQKSVAHAFAQDQLLAQMIAVRRFADGLRNHKKMQKALDAMQRWLVLERQIAVHLPDILQEQSSGHVLLSSVRAQLGDEPGAMQDLRQSLECVQKAGHEHVRSVSFGSYINEANEAYQRNQFGLGEKYRECAEMCASKSEQDQKSLADNRWYREQAEKRLKGTMKKEGH